MTPLAIAHTRPTSDPDAFLMAFTAATQAGRWDLDLEAMLRQALRDERYAKAAGLLEGIAAVHAEAGWPTHPAPDWHRHRNSRGRFTDPRATCPECEGPLHDGPCSLPVRGQTTNHPSSTGDPA